MACVARDICAMDNIHWICHEYATNGQRFAWSERPERRFSGQRGVVVGVAVGVAIGVVLEVAARERLSTIVCVAKRKQNSFFCLLITIRADRIDLNDDFQFWISLIKLLNSTPELFE